MYACSSSQFRDAAEAPRMLELFPTPVAVWRWPHAAAHKSALLQAVETRRATSSGVVRTNLGGWHSDPDLPSWPEPAIQQLVHWIAGCARLTTLLHHETTDVTTLSNWRMSGWANANPPGAWNRSHHHAQSNWHWSACYYVNLGSIGQEDADLGGALVFQDRRSGLGLKNRGGLLRQHVHHPAEGELILFPSWLYHTVQPHHAEETRVSMAFNLHTPGLERSRLWEHRPTWAWRKFPALMRRVATMKGQPDGDLDAVPPGVNINV